MLSLFVPCSIAGHALVGIRGHLHGSAQGVSIANSATQQAAYGLHFYASRLEPLPGWTDSWLATARKMTAWTLLAPQQSGFFPTAYDVGRARWWQPATTADEETGGAGLPYDVRACSATGTWLLRHYTDREDDVELLARARRLGDGLSAIQQSDGDFPVYDGGSQIERPGVMLMSALPAAALFLCHLTQITGHPPFARTLSRACDALTRLTTGPATADGARATAGLALLKTYRVSGDREHRRAGLCVADDLLPGGDTTLCADDDGEGARPLLLAEAYRHTVAPRYAEGAMEVIRTVLPVPRLPLDGDHRSLAALAAWAVIEANYPDVLCVTTPTPSGPRGDESPGHRLF